MPPPRQINVLADLKTLSDESDKNAQDCFKDADAHLRDWYDSCLQVITKIRDASSVGELRQIQYPVLINSTNIKKGISKAGEVVGVEIERIHQEKQPTVSNEIVKDESLENKDVVKLSAVVNHTPHDKITVPHEVVSCKLPKKEEVNKLLCTVENHTPCDKVTVAEGSLTVVKKGRLMPSLVLKNAISGSVKKYDEKVNASLLSSASKHRNVFLQQTTPGEDSRTESVLTPESQNLNRTLNKIADRTITVDSSQKSKILNEITRSGVLTRSGSKKMKVASSENSTPLATDTPLLNRTFKKTANETVIIESGQKSEVLKESTRGILTRSGSKTVTTSENPADGKLTRSGSKRKSSGKNSCNKKQKLNNRQTPKKISKPKRLPKKNHSKSSLLSTPVIVPPPQSKPSVVSKEQQILEEIKKKEVKANSNIKRVLAERQQKAELNKKNLEEKRKKVLEKRMQIEKEKEERLRQESQGIKLFKSHADDATKKTNTRELTENDGKENKSMVSDSGKLNDTYSVNAAAKTPVPKKSHNSDCYELTPVPDSSTYNFSDDEEDESVNKPIPNWAQGVALKTALMQQYYCPVDPKALFGSYLENPDLAEIFKINKTRYKKRTSSAVWNSSFRC